MTYFAGGGGFAWVGAIYELHVVIPPCTWFDFSFADCTSAPFLLMKFLVKYKNKMLNFFRTYCKYNLFRRLTWLCISCTDPPAQPYLFIYFVLNNDATSTAFTGWRQCSVMVVDFLYIAIGRMSFLFQKLKRCCLLFSQK